MIEDLLKAAILGIVQGLTEFLPVSSTGHLILTEKVLGVDQDTYGLSFDAALHLGTMLALLAFFGRAWVELALGALRTVRTRSLEGNPDGRLAWLIVLGTIPAGVTGFLFESKVEDTLRSPALIATMLILVSGVFLLAEAIGTRLRSVEQMTPLDSLFVGVAQAVALIPGVSRSGATISAGLLRNFNREDAARFAFLLSAPVIAGGGAKKMFDVVKELRDGTLGGDDAAFFATGFILSALVGYASVAYLMRYVRTNSLRGFAYYRVALGVTIFGVLLVRAIA